MTLEDSLATSSTYTHKEKQNVFDYFITAEHIRYEQEIALSKFLVYLV